MILFLCQKFDIICYYKHLTCYKINKMKEIYFLKRINNLYVYHFAYYIICNSYINKNVYKNIIYVIILTLNILIFICMLILYKVIFITA